jgi:hypothetical protein
MGWRAALAALAVAGVLGCNDAAGPGAMLVAGTWVTRCPDEPGCVPEVELHLVQRTDSVFGDGTIILERAAFGGGWTDRTSNIQGVVHGSTLTAALQVQRNTAGPIVLTESAWGSFSATVSNSGASRVMQLTITMPATASFPAYTETSELVSASVQ